MDELAIQRRQRDLLALYQTAPMRALTGMELSYPVAGRARFDRPYEPGFDHALGQIHGGLIGTLLDNAGWFTAALYYDTWIGTADYHVRLHEPAERVDLVATGELVRAGSKLAVTTMEVRTADGLLIATGDASFAVSRLSRPPAPVR